MYPFILTKHSDQDFFCLTKWLLHLNSTTSRPPVTFNFSSFNLSHDVCNIQYQLLTAEHKINLRPQLLPEVPCLQAGGNKQITAALSAKRTDAARHPPSRASPPSPRAHVRPSAPLFAFKMLPPWTRRMCTPALRWMYTYVWPWS